MSHRDTKIEGREKITVPHVLGEWASGRQSGTIWRGRKIVVGVQVGLDYGGNREACMAVGGDGGLRVRG